MPGRVTGVVREDCLLLNCILLTRVSVSKKFWTNRNGRLRLRLEAVGRYPFSRFELESGPYENISICHRPGPAKGCV
jgi:hypothetical protein